MRISASNRLDKNQLRKLLANSKPRIANQADQVAAAREQADYLILAKAQFAQAMLDLGGSAQALYSHRNAGFHAAERAHLTTTGFDAPLIL